MKRKSRRLLFLLILLTLAAFAVWLEPTRVVWGWLRGEAFYQGRPTSWWAGEIAPWKPDRPTFKSLKDSVLTVSVQYVRPSDQFRRWFGRYVNMADPVWPPLLDGDVRGEPVLRELLSSRELVVREWAHIGLTRLQTHESGPHMVVVFQGVREYMDDAHDSRWTAIDGRRHTVRVPGRHFCVDDVWSGLLSIDW